jgi:hypothetical protein
MSGKWGERRGCFAIIPMNGFLQQAKSRHGRITQDQYGQDMLRVDPCNLAQIGAVRGRAAYRISVCGVYRSIEVCPFGAERVVVWRANFVATLPPTMLADHDAGVEAIVQADAGTHAAKGSVHRHPIS